MINPRFVESKSNSLRNEWITFSRLHTLMFWKQNIAYSWIPGTFSNRLKKTLFRENGLGQDWPQEFYEINDDIITASIRDIQNREHAFTIIQHPATRALAIPRHLAKNRDNCAQAWAEITGKQWNEFTFEGLIQELERNKALLIASHWWCPQEYCFVLHADSYDKIFREEQDDDIAWWLGERGIQLERESETKRHCLTPASLPSHSEYKDTLLSSLGEQELNGAISEGALLDISTYEIIQEIYKVDALIYGRD